MRLVQTFMLYIPQVLPVVIQNLPLKEDLEENKTVYGCIVRLFEASNPIVSVQHGCLLFHLIGDNRTVIAINCR